MPDGSLKLRGRVAVVLGDNIDTDLIYPGRYLNITDREKTAEHLFELAYPEIRANLRPASSSWRRRISGAAPAASRPPRPSSSPVPER